MLFFFLRRCRLAVVNQRVLMCVDSRLHLQWYWSEHGNIY